MKSFDTLLTKRWGVNLSQSDTFADIHWVEIYIKKSLITSGTISVHSVSVYPRRWKETQTLNTFLFS